MLRVSGPLVIEVLLNGLQRLSTDPRRMFFPSLLDHLDSLPLEIHLIELQPGQFSATDARPDEGVNDGPIPIGTIVLASRSLLDLTVAMTILGAPPGFYEHISSIEHPAFLSWRQRPFYEHRASGGYELDLIGGIAERKRAVFVDPFGQDLHMGEYAIDRAIPPAAMARRGQFFAQSILEGP